MFASTLATIFDTETPWWFHPGQEEEIPVPREDRKRIWIDRFQTQLSLRIGLYLVVFLFVLVNFLFAWRLWQEGPGNPADQFVRMLRDYLPVGIAWWFWSR